MKIRIICVGKIKEIFYRDAISEYSKRLSKFATLEICELPDEKTPDKASDAENKLIVEKEGLRILDNIRSNEYVICLALEGKKTDSVAFSKKINDIAVNGYNCIDFIIGGSLGLSDTVKKRGDFLLSFSDFTFPHQLMRVILAEQIYRAFKILNNEPYHK